MCEHREVQTLPVLLACILPAQNLGLFGKLIDLLNAMCDCTEHAQATSCTRSPKVSALSHRNVTQCSNFATAAATAAAVVVATSIT
jgi:hypothetical protein